MSTELGELAGVVGGSGRVRIAVTRFAGHGGPWIQFTTYGPVPYLQLCETELLELVAAQLQAKYADEVRRHNLLMRDSVNEETRLKKALEARREDLALATSELEKVRQANREQTAAGVELQATNTRLLLLLRTLVESVNAGFAEVSDAVHRQRRAGKSQHIGQTMAVATLMRHVGRPLVEAENAAPRGSDNRTFRQPEKQS